MIVDVVDIDLDGRTHRRLDIDTLHVDRTAVGVDIILRHAVDGLEVNPILAEHEDRLLVAYLHLQVEGQTATAEQREDVEAAGRSHQHGRLTRLLLLFRQRLNHRVKQLGVLLDTTGNLNLGIQPS